MRTRFLVSYDIRDPKRLRHVHKTVLGFGYPLQYSVFVCDLSRVEQIEMVEELGDIIDFARDSVAFIDLGPADSRGSECFSFMGTRDDLPIPSKARIL